MLDTENVKFRNIRLTSGLRIYTIAAVVCRLPGGGAVEPAPGGEADLQQQPAPHPHRLLHWAAIHLHLRHQGPAHQRCPAHR